MPHWKSDDVDSANAETYPPKLHPNVYLFIFRAHCSSVVVDIAK